MKLLETDRLLLRQWEDRDFEPYAELCADAEVMQYLGGKPLSREEAWRRMAMMVGHWHLRGFGMWVVEEKASGRFVGRSGFNCPEGWPGLELGWALSKSVWGLGYASEAGRAALGCAFSVLDRDQVISLITPGHDRAVLVATRLGMKLEGETTVMERRVQIYGIERLDWRRSLDVPAVAGAFS